MKLEGNTKKTKCQTLIPADIDPELGIEARSFDTTIETMNRIQEAIFWADIDPELGIEARSFDTTIETMNRIQEAIFWSEE